VEELDSRLEPGAVLQFVDDNPITLGDLVGTPIQYIYGHRIYSLRVPKRTDTVALNEAVKARVNGG
jgi:hypothetical protein